MSNKDLREIIESEIRSKTGYKGNFKEKHNEFYDTFFRIFSELDRKYKKESNNKKISIIDFIEQNGKLEELFEIVKGNSWKVKKKHYDKLKEEGERRSKELIEKEMSNREEKLRLEWIEKRNEYYIKKSNCKTNFFEDLEAFKNEFPEFKDKEFNVICEEMANRKWIKIIPVNIVSNEEK